MKKYSKIILVIIFTILIIGTPLFFYTKKISQKLNSIYNQNESVIIRDRNNKIVYIKQNSNDNYALYDGKFPDNLKKYLTQKEDNYFYYHPGINPISIFRALWHYLSGDKNLTSSTITQQLVKILSNQESDRSLKNKIKESLYALSLEMYSSKSEILNMYLNSIYLGNNIQGIKTASQFYFNTSPDSLSDEQLVQLLATISSPTNNYPFTANNIQSSISLGSQFGININQDLLNGDIDQNKKAFQKYIYSNNYFEWSSLESRCQNNCQLTYDDALTTNLRSILQRNLQAMIKNNASNGAIIVLKQPENELIAMVGSPDPSINSYGYKINMSTRPRPIGSTIKPLIYLKAFEKNLRPYTMVDDKEYKYTIGDGFAFYPKNYDYQYRGLVNLHYALSNSLNVPTVKVLEYVGINNFNNFLVNDLQFKPIQDINNYQLGIGLGGLETDLLTLAYYFSIFPNHGQLKPLRITQQGAIPQSSFTNYNQNKKISSDKYVELINKILSDRLAGVEQFGIKSNLNLPHDNYALKTGTSREFHDSWTVGYTPDFLVAVWVGNSDNTPMDQISGSAGAGRVWQEAMNLLYNSPYNHNTPFNFQDLKTYSDENNNLEYGLADDDYEKSKNLLEIKNLILKPYNGDVFLLQDKMKIPFSAREEVDWFVDGKLIEHGLEISFSPTKIGTYKIKALSADRGEEITIITRNDE